MKLKRDTKFGGESTRRLKIGVRNSTNFDPSTRKVSKIFILMCSFFAKYILFGLKKYRWIIFHWNLKGYKTSRGIDLLLQNWQILIWALESLKNFHFNGLLLSKVYLVWAKNVQRSYLSWNWRGIKNLERNQHVV